MSDFAALLAAALVGTGRVAPPTPSASALGRALASLAGRDAEGTLLARAALAGLAEQAGLVASPAPLSIAPPAPPEVRPEAPQRAARHLPLVLDGPLLPEWLRLCAETGYRVPPAHLPELLDRARQDRTLREALRPVLGERGAWLAQFRAEWRFTPAAFSEEAWDEATEAGREALFRALRGDAPQAARELLQAQFGNERAGSRKRLLNALNDTLQPDDLQLEPLLEAALSDRSSDVQELSRLLLQRLSPSAYNARMAARLRGLLHPEKAGRPGKPTARRKASLPLPDAPDPDQKRDGFGAGLTARGYVQHLLRGAHPDPLLRALGLTPAELVALAREHDALEDLAHAALATAHREVAQALAPHAETRRALARLASDRSPAAEAEDALAQHDTGRLLAALDELPGPWPAALSARVLDALRHAIRNAEFAYGWPQDWRHIFPLALTRAHPDAPRPPPLPGDAPDFARQTLNELTATLEWRRQMWRDFQTDEGATP